MKSVNVISRNTGYTLKKSEKKTTHISVMIRLNESNLLAEGSLKHFFSLFMNPTVLPEHFFSIKKIIMPLGSALK